MNETLVYILTKRYLRGEGWHIIGGQPPNGTDAFPVIEIADSEVEEKGSRGSFKPDLLAVCPNSWLLVIIECKPAFSSEDVEKLVHAVQPRRISMLDNEIKQRGIFDRLGWPVQARRLSAKNVIPCVAFVGLPRLFTSPRQIVFNQGGELSASTLVRVRD